MKVSIKRKINSKEFIEDFKIEQKDETILELLDRIRDKKRDLTYRSFCRSSICGTCAIKVNGKSVLACKTKVSDFDSDIFIEPISRVNVIKDLVVDHSYIEKSIKDNKAWFVDEIRDDKENIQYPKEFEKFNLQTDCILCMACYAECDALDYESNFSGPFAFTKVFRFVFDSRDKEDKQNRIEIAKENFLYSCVNCQKCAMVCPKGISSAMDIKMLQNSDKNPPFNDNFNVGFF